MVCKSLLFHGSFNNAYMAETDGLNQIEGTDDSEVGKGEVEEEEADTFK